MKRVFLVFYLLVCSCFVSPAAAQEAAYTVTEAELTELESIVKNLQQSKQNLQLQAKNLTERLKEQESKAKTLAVSLQQADSKAKTLAGQLQAERQSLTALQKSYNAYEKEAAAALEAKQRENKKLTTKLYRRTIVLVILSTLFIGSVLFTVVKWYLKGRLRLFSP